MSAWDATSLRCCSSRSRQSVCWRASPWRLPAPPAISQLSWTSSFRYSPLLAQSSLVLSRAWALMLRERPRSYQNDSKDVQLVQFLRSIFIYNCWNLFFPSAEASGAAVLARWGESKPEACRANALQETVGPAGVQSRPWTLSHNQGRQWKPPTQRPGPSLHR